MEEIDVFFSTFAKSMASIGAFVAGDKFVMCQVITFTHASDFANDAAVLSSEVITAVNNALLGGVAEIEVKDGRVLLTGPAKLVCDGQFYL